MVEERRMVVLTEQYLGQELCHTYEVRKSQSEEWKMAAFVEE